MTMNMPKIIVTVLVALAFAINIPSESLAQGGQTGRQIPQPEGGIATVIGVDQPENCLRIRSGPGNFYDVIGCANIGDQLNITGVWTSNDWAQLADNGWVYGPQIQTDLRPPRTAYYQSPSYVATEEVTPDYYDWGYLPDYGYNTYWYGGIPIFLYNIGVWNRFHPWWWYRGHQAWWWNDGHKGRRPWNSAAYRDFLRGGGRGDFARHRGGMATPVNRGGTGRGFVTNRGAAPSFNSAGTRRSFTPNRFNMSPSNVNRLNTNSLRSGSANAFPSRAFSNPNRVGSGSVNTFRSRTFSTPQAFRGGSNFGARQFSGVGRSGGFSGARIGGGGGVGRIGGGGGGGARFSGGVGRIGGGGGGGRMGGGRR
jgi:hypothetical protein